MTDDNAKVVAELRQLLAERWAQRTGRRLFTHSEMDKRPDA